jgi:hypothetical protein
MHFSSFDKLLYSSEKKSFCLLSKPEMHHLVHLIIAVKSSSLQCFLKHAKHVTVGWSKVWTVRGMIYGLKFQFLDVGNCLSSSMWLSIIMEDTSGQKSAMMTMNRRLQFFFQRDAVPHSVDCLSFLLIVFENWSTHIPEQC